MEAAEEAQSLLEWLAEHYKEFGCALEFVSDKSQEGSQFVKGFSGIGGILRYVLRIRADADECMLMVTFSFRYKVDSATLMNDSDFEDDEFYGSDSDSGMFTMRCHIEHALTYPTSQTFNRLVRQAPTYRTLTLHTSPDQFRLPKLGVEEFSLLGNL